MARQGSGSGSGGSARPMSRPSQQFTRTQELLTGSVETARATQGESNRLMLLAQRRFNGNGVAASGMAGSADKASLAMRSLRIQSFDAFSQLAGRPDPEETPLHRIIARCMGIARPSARVRHRYSPDGRHRQQRLLRIVSTRRDDVTFSHGDGQRRQCGDDAG